MASLPDLFMTVHVFLLVGFTSVTALLLLVTLLNRYRVQDVLLAWGTGRFLNLPLWPSAFLGVVLACGGISLALGRDVPLGLFAGYLAGGACWFAAARLSRAVIVTGCGFISDLGRQNVAVAWHQVADYFETGGDRHAGYVFFYVDADGQRHRLDLAVPPAHRTAFRRIVREQLDERFETSVQQEKEFEG